MRRDLMFLPLVLLSVACIETGLSAFADPQPGSEAVAGGGSCAELARELASVERDAASAGDAAERADLEEIADLIDAEMDAKGCFAGGGGGSGGGGEYEDEDDDDDGDDWDDEDDD